MKSRFIKASGDNRIDSLLSGTKWGEENVGSAVTLTYSIPEGSTYWSYTEEANAGFSTLSGAQRDHFRSAMNTWAEVTQLTLTEVPDSTTYGDIRIAYTQSITGNTQAYAYLPGTGTYSGDIITPNAKAGDIWVNPSLTDLAPGSTGYSTLLHEIGHALGLKHSFEAEGGFPAVASGFDDTHYTVMSYTDYDGAGFVYTDVNATQYTFREVMPTTLMPYDILAAQYLYGTDTTTRTGDDTYTFGTSAELKTIWDAGGMDTIDASNQTQFGVNINLVDGAFSDIGARQTSYAGEKQQAIDNIAIAYGVVIENAIGSGLADTLTGNNADNTLQGGGGNDTIDGGAGTDTAKYSGQKSAYTVTKESNGSLTVEGADGKDTLQNIEQLAFDDGTFVVSELLSSTKIPTQKSEVDLTPGEAEMAYFLLEIADAQGKDVSVQYSTRDGSAVAGQDYVATSGTATIAAGETHLAIAVALVDDNIAEGNETFSLVVTNPSGGIFPDNAVELVAQRTIIDNDSVV